MKRKICIVSGGRADYGFLKPIIDEVIRDQRLTLSLVMAEFSNSAPRAIEAEYEQFTTRLSAILPDTTPVAVTKALSEFTTKFAQLFNSDRPEILLVLGDRYEVFAAAQAAMIARIPIAHLHGGERTGGLIDESIRHSITKMSMFHFVAAEPYRKRVLQLGVPSNKVFNFGSPIVDAINSIPKLTRRDLTQRLEIPEFARYILITYHPRTLAESPLDGAVELLKALDQVPDCFLIFTAANNDPAGCQVNDLLKEFVARNVDRSRFFESLGAIMYPNAIRHSAAVVGNSSSGLIEAPLLGAVSVNIGNRQEGRLRSSSVIDCEEQAEQIAGAVGRALDESSRDLRVNLVCPYQANQPSKLIVDRLAAEEINQLNFMDFVDINF
jgi:UDP-N-acetylglucosamine 2-epimerase (non-hydrolysing)/GDP/UDP-N,N'-diacetylbacillosamine 2-epimerase (hydrolysing)